MSTLIAFAHHLAALTLVGALVAEHALFSPRPELAQARRLVRLDALYGASAGVLLAVGLVRVFFLEKGAAYYFGNPYFLANPVVARRIPLLIRLQLVAIAGAIFCAPFMAKGFA